jgi:hypothetical protein
VLTHQVSVDPARRIVIKRFIQARRGEPEREWRALTLLAEHAPGLAAEPILADLAANPAVIEMSLLPGEPLGGRPLTTAQESALARAIGQLWQSVPVIEVTLLPGESGNQAQLVREVSELAANGPYLGDDSVVRAARSAGLDWLSWAVTPGGGFGLADSQVRAARVAGWPAFPPVFGQGDANLANFLWDGDRVRMVDFEDSGPSDRSFELAVLVEHVSAWSESALDGERFVGAFDLSPAERVRLADWRRLAALFWLLRTPLDDASKLRRQAERLTALL